MYLSRIALALALAGALLAVVFLDYRTPADVPTSLSVEPQSTDLGEVTVGPQILVVRITNPTEQPRRILGMVEGCSRDCCYVSKHRSHVIVPPDGHADYSYELSIYRPGPFEQTITLFLEDNGIREVNLAVRGVGISPEGNLDAPDKP